MPSEPIFFHEGLSTDTRSALQKPGFLRKVENLLLEVDGKQSLRPFFGTTFGPFGPIHSIKFWRNLLVTGDGGNLRGNGTLLSDTFTSGKPWQFKAYKDFLAATNGAEFVLIDSSSNLYPAQVEAPALAPTGTSGASGAPNGTYRLYVSFYVVWPNGHTYETGLSPLGADVTVSSDKIEWKDIPTSPYEALHGTAPTIYRNLYRGPGTGGTLADIFYVDTIGDNTTTTFSDNVSDADLGAGYVETVSYYEPPIVPKFMEWHYGRLFAIDPTFTYRLYHSEVAQGNTAIANEQLFPIAMPGLNYDDLRVAGFDECDPQGVVSWGTYIYIPLKQTWIRKQGDDPATWAFRKTYASHGIVAPWTLNIADQGIFGVAAAESGDPALSVFNGQYSELVSSPRLDELLRTDINISAMDQCRGRVVGKYYFLLYPSVGQTVPDRILAIDLRRYPNLRVAYWTDLYGNSLDNDRQGTRVFFGGSDGYVRERDVAEEVSFSVETHDLVGGKPEAATFLKTWKELKYSLKGTATLEVYIDEVLKAWPDGTTTKVLSGVDDTLQVLKNFPPDWHGYKIRLALSGVDATTFELYSPWELNGDPKLP